MQIHNVLNKTKLHLPDCKKGFTFLSVQTDTLYNDIITGVRGAISQNAYFYLGQRVKEFKVIIIFSLPGAIDCRKTLTQ